MDAEVNINLVEETREEYERNLPDVIRFQNYQYYGPQDLHFFKDPYLRQLFEEVFIKPSRNIHQVLKDAVRAYPGSKFRIEQVKALILQTYVKDDKLTL